MRSLLINIAVILTTIAALYVTGTAADDEDYGSTLAQGEDLLAHHSALNAGEVDQLERVVKKMKAAQEKQKLEKKKAKKGKKSSEENASNED